MRFSVVSTLQAVVKIGFALQVGLVVGLVHVHTVPANFDDGVFGHELHPFSQLRRIVQAAGKSKGKKHCHDYPRLATLLFFHGAVT